MSRADEMRAKAARLNAGASAGQPRSASGAAAYPPPPPVAPAVPPRSVNDNPPPAAVPAASAPAGRSVSRSAKPSGKVRLVRMTLDLVPTLHADFEDWTTRTSRKFGRVSKADVLRELVRQLLHDKDLQARVAEALRRETD